MIVDKVLNKDEEDALDTLRKRMKNDIMPEEYNDIAMFYRFLKARNFNIDSAEKMLRKHLHWRKENRVDHILEEHQPIEVIQKYVSHSHIGFDKEGSPCRYLPIGKIDTKGALQSCTYEDLMKSLIYAKEGDIAAAEEQSRKRGKCIDKSSYILDFGGLTFASATDKLGINYAVRLLMLYQDNYPERLKVAYIINTSGYFTLVYSMLKHFISSSVLQKLRVYGTDDWQEDFRKFFNPDELPVFLGGNKTDKDGDPMCKSYIYHGGTIPEKYYRTKSKVPTNSFNGKKLILMRASFHEITLQVDEENSLIEWKFKTKSRDIGFGVFHREVEEDGEEKLTELIPLERIDTEKYPETGMCRCGKAGTYIILFDNSYSWIRSKEIYYKVSIVKPKEHVANLLV